MARCAASRLGSAGAKASPWCAAAVALAAAGPPAFAKHEKVLGTGIDSARPKGSSHGDHGTFSGGRSFATGATEAELDGGQPEETSAAPYLRLYFDAVTRATTEFYQSMVDGGSRSRAQAGLKNIRAALDEARPLLERSFRHHDSDGDGVLDVQEARAFFSHVVSEEGGLIEAVYTGVTMKYMQRVILDADDDGACDAMQSIHESQATLRRKLESNVQHYLQNKELCDEAAFAVCDVNRSGTLELNEVVNALDPLHPRNDLFAHALGFTKEYKDLAATYVEIDQAAADDRRRAEGQNPSTAPGMPSDLQLRSRLAMAAAAGGIAVVGILVQRNLR